MSRLRPLAIISLILIGTLNSQQIPAKHDVIDVFMKCASKDEKQKFNDAMMKYARQAPIEALRFSSPVVTVPHTEYSVTGNPPICGNGPADPIDQSKEYIKAMAAAAAFIDVAGGTGGLATAIAAALGKALQGLGVFGKPTQTTANCLPVCALVPGVKPVGSLPVGSWKTIWYWDSPGASKFVAAQDDWLNWAYLGNITSFDAKITTQKPGSEDKTTGCAVTAVCFQLRNWSDSRDRSAQIHIDVPMDAVDDSCVDYSVINREKFEDVMFRQVKEKAMRYYNSMMTNHVCGPNN